MKIREQSAQTLAAEKSTRTLSRIFYVIILYVCTWSGRIKIGTC